MYGKIFVDREFIKRELFGSLSGKGIYLVYCVNANMKNRFISMYDKVMLRMRYVIDCINDLLKNKTDSIHSRYRAVHNLIVNVFSALTAYYFFDNKPEAMPVHVEKTRQMDLF